MAVEQYGEAKTNDQRAIAVEYLQHLDHTLVADEVVDHIIASRNGTEATAYNALVHVLGPDGYEAVLDRLAQAAEPVEKGKLVVALGHCHGEKVVHALQACMDDKRPVPFEAHGASPRRVCDLAYDELYLKLRTDPHYGLDASAKMKGSIDEKMPVKKRDALIAKLKANLAKYPPLLGASASPEPAKPAATP